MRRTFIIICISVSILLHAQETKEKRINPFSFEASYAGDNFYNFTGGIKTGYTYMGLMDMTIGLDTEKAKLWKGGEFFIHGSNSHGGEATGSYVGDFQGVSNIEAGNHTFLYELWYKQSIWKIDLILGLQDLNAEFAASEYAGLFLNGSFGIHPVIGDNSAAPIFPITALGVSIIFNIKDNLTFKTALYDGTITDFEDNEYNLNWSISKEDGFSSYSELQYTSNLLKDKNGIYSIGYFIHKHTDIDTLENVNTEALNEPKQGLYLIIDQELITKGDKSLAAFIQTSYSPKSGDNNFFHIGGGMLYTGAFNRSNDELGIAFAQAHMQDNGIETTIEFSYKLAFWESIYAQACMQYISNPGGDNAGLNNALVGLLRVGYSF